jgi:hypothetical protein
MFRMIPLAAVLAVLITGVAGITGGALRPDAPARPQLHGGAASIDKLLDRLLEALKAKDRGALEAIRVTEDEYRNVIVPGSVQKGEPRQRVGEEAFEYYWGLLNGKSIYHRENMLARFGGREWVVRSVRPQKGMTEYAGYTAHRRLVIDLVNEASGEEAELETGSVAEVDGRFKFISYIRD